MEYADFALARSTAKPEYEKDFYGHLNALAATEFASPSRVQFKFSMAKYDSLQQAAFEDGPSPEDAPKEPDWQKIDSRVDQFETALKSTIGTDDDNLAKVVRFSARTFEQWITYEEMYEGRASNPWAPAVQMLRRGRLLYVSDRVDELNQMSHTATRGVNDSNRGNVGGSRPIFS